VSDIGTNNKKEYWMPHHTRACVTATGAVLLDLKRNRYFGLGYREARSLSALAQNWSSAAATQSGSILDPMSADDAARLADALVKAGFLTPVAPTGDALAFRSIDSTTELTSVGYELQRAVRLRFRHVIAFARACLWAKRAVDSRLLYSVALEVAGYRQSEGPYPANVQLAIELVCVFRRLRPYAFAAKDQCLFHALALLKFLSHYNIFPTWVIAVRPTPWAAHSWLQLGSLVLDCNPEEISGYTPILVI
jgi:hypothetical protein